MRPRHALWIGLVGLAGCTFDSSGLSPSDPEPAPDARPTSIPDARDGDRDAPALEPDAGVTPPPQCSDGQKRWRAEFDEDPTAVDDNDDDVPDWVMADGSGFPVQDLDDDVWRANDFDALHTNPQEDLIGIVKAEVQMRSVAPGQEPFDLGAVMWLSADTNVMDPGFTSLYVSLEIQEDATQDLRLVDNQGNGVEVLLLEATGLDDDFVEVTLQVDASADRVDLWIDGVHQGSAPYAPAQVNRVVGVLGFGSRADFDRVRVDLCEP